MRKLNLVSGLLALSLLLLPLGAGAEGDGNRPVGQLPGGLKLLVKDASALNELMNSGGSFFVQEGKLVRNADLLDRSKNFCFLTKTWPTYAARNGDEIVMPYLQVTTMRIAGVAGDGSASLGCTRQTAARDWLLSELRDAFGAMAALDSAQP